MKILVTGSGGLLGQKLAALLTHNKNVTPILTARKKITLPFADDIHALDITDAVAVDNALARFTPDVVINTAAMTMVDHCELHQEECWRANVTSVENLIQSCEKYNAHLMHVSTDFIFDGSFGPLDESAKPNPVNYYGKSKLAAEEFVKKSKTRWSIIRTVLVYGITADMSRSNIVLWVKQSLEQGKAIKVVNDQWRTPTLAEDLAMGCYLAAIKNAQGIYHISGKDFMSPYEIAIRTADYFKLDKSLISPTDSSQFTQPARRPPKTGFIIDKARRDLGYEPHTFSEGLHLLSTQMGK
jgi:dTDP-4-dehydrorhamnose reductase